jgi:hypothetical protein
MRIPIKKNDGILNIESGEVKEVFTNEEEYDNDFESNSEDEHSSEYLRGRFSGKNSKKKPIPEIPQAPSFLMQDQELLA